MVRNRQRKNVSLDELRQVLGVGSLHYPLFQSRFKESQILSRLVAVGKLILRVSDLKSRWKKVLEDNPKGQLHERARVKISNLDKALESLYHGPATKGLLSKNELSSPWRVSDQYEPSSIEEVEKIANAGRGHPKNKKVHAGTKR